MPSPFPGMDPYLERHWGDVHTALTLYIRDALRPWLPTDLYARVEERVYIDLDQDVRQTRIPDVRISQSKPATTQPFERQGITSATLAPPEPVVIELPDPEVTERFVEIREATGEHRVITVIEVLSPANKRSGRGRQEYQRKVDELQRFEIALLEIDLLRGGRSIFPAETGVETPENRTCYRAVVWRPDEPHVIESYRMSLREPLRPVPVPLRTTDADAILDLQALIAQVYENGNYAMTTDYSQPPEPPLTKADAEWAQALTADTSKN